MSKTAKEKLVDLLVNKNGGELFDQFLIVGLQNSLDTTVEMIEVLLAKPYLKEHERKDLHDLCHDGKAMLHVLRYYTPRGMYSYIEEESALNMGYQRMLTEFL